MSVVGVCRCRMREPVGERERVVVFVPSLFTYIRSIFYSTPYYELLLFTFCSSIFISLEKYALQICFVLQAAVARRENHA